MTVTSIRSVQKLADQLGDDLQGGLPRGASCATPPPAIARRPPFRVHQRSQVDDTHFRRTHETDRGRQADTRQLAQWVTFLRCYMFLAHHIPGASNMVYDLRSRNGYMTGLRLHSKVLGRGGVSNSRAVSSRRSHRRHCRRRHTPRRRLSPQQRRHDNHLSAPICDPRTHRCGITETHKHHDV